MMLPAKHIYESPLQVAFRQFTCGRGSHGHEEKCISQEKLSRSQAEHARIDYRHNYFFSSASKTELTQGLCKGEFIIVYLVCTLSINDMSTQMGVSC